MLRPPQATRFPESQGRVDSGCRLSPCGQRPSPASCNTVSLRIKTCLGASDLVDIARFVRITFIAHGQVVLPVAMQQLGHLLLWIGTFVLTAVILVLVQRFLFHADPIRKLPPGPNALPLVGNLHQISTEYQAQRFAEWAKKYGERLSSLYSSPLLTVVAQGT